MALVMTSTVTAPRGEEAQGHHPAAVREQLMLAAVHVASHPQDEVRVKVVEGSKAYGLASYYNRVLAEYAPQARVKVRQRGDGKKALLVTSLKA